MGCLGYVSIRLFDAGSICFSCDIVEWEGDMNHTSLNTSSIFGICICFLSSICGLTITIDSMVIPRSAGSRVERSCVHCGVEILDIWSPSGVFSWWFERLLVGSQREYFGCHMVEIE